MMTDEAAVLLGSKLSQTDVSGQISMCYRWLCLETNTKRYCPGPAGLGALFVKHFKINSVKYFLKIFVHFRPLEQRANSNQLLSGYLEGCIISYILKENVF